MIALKEEHDIYVAVINITMNLVKVAIHTIVDSI